MILSKFHHQNQLCSVMRNELLFVYGWGVSYI